MHLANRRQGLPQHRLLFIRQHRQILHRLPGFIEALRAIQKLEQQPAALAVQQAIGQQLRGGQTLLGQQLHTGQLTPELTCGFAADHQLG